MVNFSDFLTVKISSEKELCLIFLAMSNKGLDAAALLGGCICASIFFSSLFCSSFMLNIWPAIVDFLLVCSTFLSVSSSTKILSLLISSKLSPSSYSFTCSSFNLFYNFQFLPLTFSTFFWYSSPIFCRSRFTCSMNIISYSLTVSFIVVKSLLVARLGFPRTSYAFVNFAIFGYFPCSNHPHGGHQC